MESQTNSQEASTSEVPAQTTETPSTPASPEGVEGEQAASQEPAWTPDYKFKASGKEHEIGEMYRPLIKSQKELDEIKRLHEKAYGLESLEQNRNALKKQISEYTPQIEEYGRVKNRLNRLSHYVANKDFDSFFSDLEIPEVALVEWMKQKVEMAQNPQLAQHYEKNRQLANKQYEQNMQLEQYKSQVAQVETEQAYNYVNSVVSQQAADVAQAYDSKLGEGAFVDLVIDKGLKIQNVIGQEPELETVIELVKADLQKLGLSAAPQAISPAAGQAAQAAAPVQQKPSIPVVKAGGQSPVKQPIKSMEDLKKAAAMME